MPPAARNRPVARRWLRGPADEVAIARRCYFDPAAADLVVQFIENFCRQSKGRWAGEKLVLIDWERDWLRRLFGWKLADGRRRFRSAYLEVPKKNGKSTLLAALSLYLLLLDGEGGPEVHIFAFDRDQASIVFDESRRMILASPAIASRVEIINSRKLIMSQEGKLQANASDVFGSDGINPSVLIWDELHRQRDRKLWEVLEYAGISRDQFLRIAITTAGESESGPWWEQRVYSQKVNSGAIEDIHHLGVIYSADPRTRGDEQAEPDLDDPATWRRANPSMGHTMSEEDFRRDLLKARETPAELANFLRLRLGIVAKSGKQFLSLADWDACAEDLRGLEPCYLGLDLSSVDDLTALAVLSGDEEDGYDLAVRFWLPEARILELERKTKAPYREWARRGFLVLTPGEVIDYSWIKAEVEKLAAEREVRKVLADPFNANKLALELRDQLGLPVEFIRQGFLSLSGPSKELLRLVKSRKLRHGGNPVLRWMVSNAVEDRDPAGNIKLSKVKSSGKIDGLAATVNAVAGASSGPVEDGPSVYETRGIQFL
jgi:phage terminase large subunit-like protein